MKNIKKYIPWIIIAAMFVSGASIYTVTAIKITGPSGDAVKVNSEGQMHTVMTSKVDDGNSTSITLDPGGINTFTGTPKEILDYAVIGVAVFSDVESATDGLHIQFSTDGTNWDHDDVYTVPAGTGKTYSFQPAAKYLRIMYTNGSTIQTAFRLQTTLHKTYVKPSSHRIQDSIGTEDDAELVKSVITGEDENGVFQNARVSSVGVTLTSNFLLEVAKGNVAEHSQMNKYGHNEAVAIGPEDVWGGGGIYAFYYSTNQIVEAVSTDVDDVGTLVSSGTATGGSTTTLIDTGADFTGDGVVVGDVVINDTNGEWASVNNVTATTLTHTPISNSSSVSPASNPNESGDTYRIASSSDTGAGVIHIEGLSDSSGIWSVATETVILNGATDVAVTKTFVRMYRGFVLHAGSSGMNEGTVTVEVDATVIAGISIVAMDGQTQQAIFTVPSGKTAYFLKGYVGLGSRANPQTAGSAVFTWRARVNNGTTGVFLIKGQIEVMTTAMQYWQYEYAIPPAIPEKSDILIRCDSTTAEMGVVGAFDLLLVDN